MMTMEEPDLIAQTSEAVLDLDTRLQWFSERAAEGRDKGITWSRYTIHPQLWFLLYEGWKLRPTDEGAPRWTLTKDELASSDE